MFALRLNRSGNFDGGGPYDLESTKKVNGKKKFKAQLVAKVSFGSTPRVLTINKSAGDDALLGFWDFLSVRYPITIEFYLGIDKIKNAGQTSGTGFQFEDDSGPNLGNFTLMGLSGSWWGSEETIPFGASTSPTPFFTTNYNEDSSYYLNGNLIDTTVYVSLSIEQEEYEKSINLIDASGTLRAKVGQTRITLEGHEQGSTQGVSITFTDGNGSTNTDFRLRHNEIASFIPFSLYLGGVKVNNAVPITWPNLVYGDTNLKDLEVGGINHQNATSKMGGEYSDTITVYIIPLDTNLIGL